MGAETQVSDILNISPRQIWQVLASQKLADSDATLQSKWRKSQEQVSSAHAETWQERSHV